MKAMVCNDSFSISTFRITGEKSWWKVGGGGGGGAGGGRVTTLT